MNAGGEEAGSGLALQMKEELTKAFMGLPVNVRRHCTRVGVYAHTLAECAAARLADDYPHMDTPEILAAMHDAGQYHDLGKLLIAPYILRKAGGVLGESERELLRRHPQHTAELLDRCVVPTSESEAHWQLVRRVGLCHHERWDGLGYPAGLLGGAVPLAAQLVLMADNFDNLTSFRTAHVRMGFSEAFAMLLDEDGTYYGAEAIACLGSAREEMRRVFKYGSQTRSRY